MLQCFLVDFVPLGGVHGTLKNSYVERLLMKIFIKEDIVSLNVQTFADKLHLGADKVRSGLDLKMKRMMTNDDLGGNTQDQL